MFVSVLAVVPKASKPLKWDSPVGSVTSHNNALLVYANPDLSQSGKAITVKLAKDF